MIGKHIPTGILFFLVVSTVIFEFNGVVDRIWPSGKLKPWRITNTSPPLHQSSGYFWKNWTHAIGWRWMTKVKRKDKHAGKKVQITVDRIITQITKLLNWVIDTSVCCLCKMSFRIAGHGRTILILTLILQIQPVSGSPTNSAPEDLSEFFCSNGMKLIFKFISLPAAKFAGSMVISYINKDTRKDTEMQALHSEGKWHYLLSDVVSCFSDEINCIGKSAVKNRVHYLKENLIPSQFIVVETKKRCYVNDFGMSCCLNRLTGKRLEENSTLCALLELLSTRPLSSLIDCPNQTSITKSHNAPIKQPVNRPRRNSFVGNSGRLFNCNSKIGHRSMFFIKNKHYTVYRACEQFIQKFRELTNCPVGLKKQLLNYKANDLLEISYYASQLGKHLKILLSAQYYLEGGRNQINERSLNVANVWKNTIYPLRAFLQAFKKCKCRTVFHDEDSCSIASSCQSLVFIRDVLCQMVNRNRMSSLLYRIGEYVRFSSNVSKTISLLNKLGIMPSYSIISSNIKQNAEDVSTDCDDTVPENCEVHLCMDNNQQAVYHSIHVQGRNDVNYVEGTNVCEQLCPEENPDLYSKDDGKEAKELNEDFILPTEKESYWKRVHEIGCFKYGLSCFLKLNNSEENAENEPRNAYFLLQDQTTNIPTEYQIKKPSNLASSSNENINWNEKSTLKLSDVYLYRSEDKEKLSEMLNDQIEKYKNESRSTCFLTVDQKLYSIIQDLKQSDFRRGFKSFFTLILDSFHFNWTIDKAIFCQFSEAGLREIAVGFDVNYLKDTGYSFLHDCKNVHRSHFFLEEVYYAIYTEMLKMWTSSSEIDTQRMQHDLHYSERMFNTFDIWRKEMVARNTTFALWGGLFFDCVSISCRAWDAQRLGNWPLLLSTMKAGTGFLEYLFSWNRYNYIESCTEFLRDCECLPSYFKKQLDNGIAFCNRTGTSLNTISLGYALELFHKDLKQICPKLDSEGNAWSRMHRLMPLIDKTKESLNEIFSVKVSSEHKKYTPSLKHIESLQKFISGKLLPTEEEHEEFSSCFDSTKLLEKKFLSSRSIGFTMLKDFVSNLIRNNKNGPLKELRMDLNKEKKDIWKSVSVYEKKRTPKVRKDNRQESYMISKTSKNDILNSTGTVRYENAIPYAYTKDGLTPSTTKKSDCKKIYEDKWKNCKSSCRLMNGVVLLDALPLLFRKPPELVKCMKDYIIHFLKTFVFSYIKGDNAQVVVIVFDKQEYVVPAKALTQKKRKQENNLLSIILDTHPCSIINNAFKDWSTIQKCRHARYCFIYAMCREMESNHVDYFPTNMTYSVIIDGHKASQTLIPCEPIEFKSTLNEGTSLNLINGLRNDHGEADQIIYYCISFFLGLYTNFTVVTCDTDLINIGLLFCEKYMENDSDLKIHMDIIQPKTAIRRCDQFSISSLYSSIVSDSVLQNVRHKVESVVTAFIIAGANDYTGSIRNFSPAFVLECFLGKYCKDLMESQFKISQNAYENFVKCLYIYKKTSHFQNVAVPLSENVNSWNGEILKRFCRVHCLDCSSLKNVNLATVNTFLSQQSPQDKIRCLKMTEDELNRDKMTAEEISISTVRKTTWLNNISPENWLSADEPLSKHYLRCKFTLKHWVKVHCPYPKKLKLDKYGYRKTNDELELTSANIAYDFGDNRLNTTTPLSAKKRNPVSNRTRNVELPEVDNGVLRSTENVLTKQINNSVASLSRKGDNRLNTTTPLSAKKRNPVSNRTRIVELPEVDNEVLRSTENVLTKQINNSVASLSRKRKRIVTSDDGGEESENAFEMPLLSEVTTSSRGRALKRNSKYFDSY